MNITTLYPISSGWDLRVREMVWFNRSLENKWTTRQSNLLFDDGETLMSSLCTFLIFFFFSLLITSVNSNVVIFVYNVWSKSDWLKFWSKFGRTSDQNLHKYWRSTVNSTSDLIDPNSDRTIRVQTQILSYFMDPDPIWNGIKLSIALVQHLQGYEHSKSLDGRLIF